MVINVFLRAAKNFLCTRRTVFNALDLKIDLLHGLVNIREIFFRSAGKLFKTKIIIKTIEPTPGLPTLLVTPLHLHLHQHHLCQGAPCPVEESRTFLVCDAGSRTLLQPLQPGSLTGQLRDLRPETPPQFEPSVELSLGAASHEDSWRQKKNVFLIAETNSLSLSIPGGHS